MSTFEAGDKVNGENSEVNEEIENEDNKPFQKHFDLSDDSAESKLPKILPRNIPQIEENVHSQQEKLETSKTSASDTLDANQHPPDLFTGTFQEEQNNIQPLESNEEATDVYQKFLHSDGQTKEKENNNSDEIADQGLHANIMTSDTTGMLAEGDGCKQPITNDSIQVQSQPPSQASTSSNSQIEASEAVSIASNLQGLDNQGQIYQQQPTYVLLQTGGDQESGGTPQVFLAMQTGTPTNTDSQAYITLHPVSVEGQDLSGAFTTEGLNLQHAVLAQSGLSGDVSLELNQQVSLADIKGLPLNQTIDSHSQMYIPSGGQIVTAADGTDPSGAGVITYIQPVNSLSGTQAQVLMAVAEDDGQGSQLHGKRSANASGLDGGEHQKGDLSVPPKRRLSNDPRTCDECGRTFKYPSDLKKHLQIHTDMKKFQCEDCSRCFRRLHQLNVHKRIHSGEKPYVCNRCNAEFRHDSTLTMHIRTRHDHLKPFSCDGCGKNFGRMSHLRKHQRNVCGKGQPRGNIFACKYCEESFARKTDLRHHFLQCEKRPEKAEGKEVITPQASFSCDHCDKHFARNYDYKRHQLSHTDEKPFACPRCSKNFKERSSLYKHMKRMHSILPADGLMDSVQDEAIESEAAQRAIDAIVSSEDGMTSSPSTTDIIVSLAHGIHSSTETDTIVTAHALAQAGIIENAEQLLQGSHTIAAADILNFPEVAAALGLNTANQNSAQSMVVEQEVDSPSIVTMTEEDGAIAGAELHDGMHGQLEIGSQKEMNSLQLDSDRLIIDTNEPTNQDEPMVTNQHSDIGIHSNHGSDMTTTIQSDEAVLQQNESVVTMQQNEVAESNEREDMVVEMMKSEMGMELLKNAQISISIEKMADGKEFDDLSVGATETGKDFQSVPGESTEQGEHGSSSSDVAMSIS